jgi:hypothetical protein
LFQGVDFPGKAMMFDFAYKWKPIFGMIEQYDGISVPDIVDDEFVHSSFDLAMEYLKMWASCIWQKAKIPRFVNDYSIGTWSQYVQRSSIENSGVLMQTRHCFQLQLNIMRHTKLHRSLLFMEMLGWMRGLG